ncbi:hypothetical protein ANANG_G00037980 [Anguilla anguilla]|uniref:Uncharacterized protein n=2 Tax=Anguilla anguilla TaxID=7936 RepID=A0A9D3MSL9_ANGAN|nr:hypothetical protein ANANG_G00037980 [Anguilla anguilla]
MTDKMQEKESTLKKKLAQQELLYSVRETQLLSEIKVLEMNNTTMTTEQQKNEDSYKTQVKELEERFSDLENSLSSSNCENQMLKESLKDYSKTSMNSAEEICGLQKTLEQECRMHEDEIKSFKSQMESMTDKMQEMESTLKKELAQKEATKNETKEKFDEYRESIHKVTKDRQNFLKAEIRFHQNKAKDTLVAYRESERALDREKNKTAILHRKLDELNKKLAENSGKSQMPQEAQAPLHEKDVSTHSGHSYGHSGHPSTHSGHPSTQSGHPSTQNGCASTHRSTHCGHPLNSMRWAVDQDRDRRQWDEGRPTFRGRRGYQKNPAPFNR